MNISGITTCVGEEYAAYLARSLPVWLDTLDSLTVVRLDDRGKALATSQYNTISGRVDGGPVQRTVFTDAFTRNGAAFNKGAALNEGIAAANPSDWLLSFDCDIMPPTNWRELAEPQLEPGKLYGTPRYSPEGGRVDRFWYPRGYFQLWHVSDPAYRRSPVFDDHWPDAAGYDTVFADQWPVGGWWDLGIPLVHLGKPTTNWCGPGSTPAENKQAVQRAIERQKARR